MSAAPARTLSAGQIWEAPIASGSTTRRYVTVSPSHWSSTSPSMIAGKLIGHTAVGASSGRRRDQKSRPARIRRREIALDARGAGGRMGGPLSSVAHALPPHQLLPRLQLTFTPAEDLRAHRVRVGRGRLGAGSGSLRGYGGCCGCQQLSSLGAHALLCLGPSAGGEPLYWSALLRRAQRTKCWRGGSGAEAASRPHAAVRWRFSRLTCNNKHIALLASCRSQLAAAVALEGAAAIHGDEVLEAPDGLAVPRNASSSTN